MMYSGQDYYEPVNYNGPEIIKWLKQERPADYARMKAGEEIGYKKFVNLYNQSLKDKN